MSRSAAESLIDRRLLLAVAAGACSVRRVAWADEAPQQITGFGRPIPVGELGRGDWMIALVEGDPIFIRRRTPAQIALARATPISTLQDPERDEARAPGSGEWLTVLGVCTHAACKPTAGLGPYEGWLCVCHGSVYDLSGRVRRGPAKRNLRVVGHRMAGSSAMVLVG